MATHQIAQGIAQLGRNGDSTLVHMQPHEVAGLQAIAKANGTSLTINPETGLPEAFSLGGFFSSLLPTIAGYGAAAAFPQYALMAGIAAGAGTGAMLNKKDPLMGAITGGLGGYGGQSLQTSLAGMNAAGANAAATANPTGAANATMLEAMKADPNFVGKGLGNVDQFVQAGAGSAGVNPAIREGLLKSGMNADDALVIDAANQIKQAATPVTNTTPFMQNISASNQGIADLATFKPGAWDSFKQSVAGVGNAPVSNLSAATTLGMPLVGGLMGGIETSDIYGNPVVPQKKVIPTLNLSDASSRPLNLNTNYPTYAQGGPVSFADGGDSNKESALSLDPAGLPGGGAGAMEGAGQFEVTPGGTKLGIFATAEQIDAAKKADELAMTAQGRGLPGLGIGTGLDRNNPTMATMGQFGRMNGGMGSTAPTMGTMGALGRTAQTAQTATPKYNYLEQLNLNKQYANGGTIQSGGIRDLYGSQDDTTTGPALSRDGYGLGRLQAMADGGVAGYAEGGETKVNLNTQSGLEPITREQLQNRDVMMTASLGNPFAAYGVNPDNYDGYMNKIAGLAGAVKDRIPFAKGGYLDGPGDGMSDSIPATIEGKQPARLADGEFVVPADVVSHLGNGSTKAGSKRLYAMLDKVRKARTGTKKQGKQIKPEKYMPA